MSASRRQRDQLRQLAERYGIEMNFQDVNGQPLTAPDETVLAALRALGAEVETPDDLAPAYERLRAMEWTTVCNPATVAWDGAAGVEVRLPSRHPTAQVDITVSLEDGGELSDSFSLRGLKVVGAARPDPRTSYLARVVTLPWTLPPGYHRLHVDAGEQSGSMLVISASRKCYTHSEARGWGTFLPLYALNAETNWGAGNFSDLRRLLAWTVELGGSYAGTLPLLPAFLDQPFEHSPYSPVSRLFWNEFYIDVATVPELESSPEARALIASSEFQRELANLRQQELVDYRNGMALRRCVLQLLAGALRSDSEPRRKAFESWVEEHPRVRDYARFRAVCELQGAGPSHWPETLTAGEIGDGDYDPAAAHYHAYVQWIADSQMAACAAAGGQAGGLYLDLPLGVHGDGYDVWSEPDVFATGFAVGAPPDTLGPGGQNWGFPPLHPGKLRESGYRHFIDVARHHMRRAALLRVDHIMGLHRQYWIPDGAESAAGVYVRYPADELYAILSLESHRNRTELVGEDLGTVPPYVRPRLAEHDISRSFIVPFEWGDMERALGGVPEPAMTALNTHDLPPFVTAWHAWLDDDGRERLVTLLVEEGRLAEASDDLEAIVPAVVEQLGASLARTVIVNLEDLWLETGQQNVPGTSGEELPNWRRKAARRFEEFSSAPAIVQALGRLDSQRRMMKAEASPP
jgi:4-alpha-glucanotransferase